MPIRYRKCYEDRVVCCERRQPEGEMLIKTGRTERRERKQGASAADHEVMWK